MRRRRAGERVSPFGRDARIGQDLGRLDRPIEIERVFTAEAMRAALRSQPRDIVVSDWEIPNFGALAALDILKELRLDLPFIIVSGVVGEDTAADAMRAGAQDYISKERLTRLRPAIERELRDHAERVERRKADAAVQQWTAKYRGLMEAAPDAMVVVNGEGEIVLLNLRAEKQLGYSRDELIGQKVKSIIPKGFAERLITDGARTAAEALAQHMGTGIELLALRKDGTAFPIEIMLSPLESAEGLLVTAAIRDITARKQAEALLLRKVEELNRSNEELAQFAYIASHDLQEPLRMVASYTQLLARRYKGRLDTDADEFIAFAVDGVERLQRLFQGLLEYSRVGTKGEPLLEISSEDALEQATLNLQVAIEESGALVTHDALPLVLADQMQLIRLLQNLVGNAIKYRRPGVSPLVHISSTKESATERWRFSVRDNGLGIEAKYFARIFGMFQRLHKRDEFGGIGIGLSISKKIAERHGSSVSIESELGQGSTFHFTLADSGRNA